MIEFILKRIPKRIYNRHKHDDGYIMFPYYKIGHGWIYRINNPPDGYRYYKIVGTKINFVVSSKLYDELKKKGFT